MKATSQDVVASLASAKDVPGLFSDFMALTKARLTSLVLVTTFVGFCMASGDVFDWTLLFHTLFGTALVAGSAAVFNQAIEMNVDRLMGRTRDRPLPGGRMKQETAFALAALMGASGLGYLAATIHLVPVLLAAATLGLYVLVYTPLKRRTPFCVTVGAISGAIPPVIGWTAVDPNLSPGAAVLFGVLFLWQMPHFLSIAWMYRDEYAGAGFRMIEHSDTSGLGTASRSLFATAALFAVAIAPAWLGLNGALYLAFALALNAALLTFAIRFLLYRTRSSARRLFFASILYLPLLLGLMVCSRN